MRFSVFASLLVLTSALAQPLTAVAQDATEAPAEGAAESVVADPVAADDLALGQDVGQADGVGSTYSAGTFDAWEQRCVRSGTENDTCQLYQLLKDAQGTSVAEIALFGLPEGGEAAAGATFVAPLETLLTTGLTLQIDGDKPKGYPFSFCGTLGCVVRLGFTAEDVAKLKAGNEITASIVPFVAQDQKVELKISLKGFTKGMEAVDAANAKADAAAKAAAEAAPKE
jgi:invasion protein IalB